jgi:hypothetical protein
MEELEEARFASSRVRKTDTGHWRQNGSKSSLMQA